MYFLDYSLFVISYFALRFSFELALPIVYVSCCISLFLCSLVFRSSSVSYFLFFISIYFLLTTRCFVAVYSNLYKICSLLYFALPNLFRFRILFIPTLYFVLCYFVIFIVFRFVCLYFVFIILYFVPFCIDRLFRISCFICVYVVRAIFLFVVLHFVI